MQKNVRYRVIPGVNFKWSKDSWTHNIFRFYEVIFGRRFGIRAESSTNVDENGKSIHHFFTWEARLSHAEYRIREFFRQLPSHLPRLKFVEVYLPAFSFAGLGTKQQYLFTSIAFDLATDGGVSANAPVTYSFNHTATGSNILIFGSFQQNGNVGDTISAVTWNTTETMTRTDFGGFLAGVGQLYAYYVANATSGTHAVLITTSTANSVRPLAASYSGCANTGQPDAHTTGTGAASTTFSLTRTSIADNCWSIMGVADDNATNPPVAGSGATDRVNTAGQAHAILDNNSAKTPAGSTTVNAANGGVSASWMGCMVTIAPFASIASPRLTILDAGA